MDNRISIIRNFGEPLDPSILEEFATIDAEDIASALQWWDSNASEPFIGCLDNPPIGEKKR